MTDVTSGGQSSECRAALFYVHAMAGGGAERVMAILASGLVQRGWRIVLAVDRPDEANRAFLDPRVAVVTLGEGHHRNVLRLASLLRGEQPDVSLSAMAASNLKHVAAALLAGRLGRAVLSYHAFAASEPQRLSRAGYWTLPVLSRLAARTVAVSNALRHDLVRHWRAAERRTVTIYNPVVHGPAGARGGDPMQGPRVILTAGRLVPDKNTRAVVAAFAEIASRCDARLMILGEGPDRPAIEADIAALGLENRVDLRGYVAEPWALYRSASCFVTASRLESFSMVVAEALAFGLPVVAVDSPGPREVLADGQFGVLVPPDDPVALATALLTALGDPGDAEPRRTRGRAFSLEAGIEAYQRLFADVVAEAHRADSPRRPPPIRLSRPDPS